MKELYKFHVIWIYKNGTSFTMLLGGQKLWKFAEEDLLGKWS
jgi:hypothetical protein